MALSERFYARIHTEQGECWVGPFFVREAIYMILRERNAVRADMERTDGDPRLICTKVTTASVSKTYGRRASNTRPAEFLTGATA